MKKPIILIDWDDTLCPTTFLEENGIDLRSKIEKDSELHSQLKELDREVSTFLKKCLEHGNPMILTNAEIGWVKKSCQKFMPLSYNILLTIEIHSAREKYSKTAENPKEWKKLLLLNELKEQLLENKFVISIGDSEYERFAVMHFCKKHKNKIYAKNFLIDADVTNMESTILIIKLLNKIIKYIIYFQKTIDYVLGLKHMKSIPRSPRKSQKGLTPEHKI